jgi:branched-chain amino acid transport system substrate-binding protein
MKKRILLTAALAAGVFVGADAQTKGTIKIASQTPLSGGQSNLGTAIKNGAEMAISEEKRLIEAFGYKVVYQPEDDQATANVGVANANRLINDPEIMGIVGHLNSGVAIPSSEVYAKVNLTMVSPANTNPRVTDRLSTAQVTNRICGRDDVQGPVGADFVVNVLKAKRIYVLNNKTAYGEGIANAFAARAKQLGAKVLVEAGQEAADTDFSSFINKAKADKPDAIYFGAIYTEAAPMLKQLRQAGLNTPLVGGDGFDGQDLQNTAGADNMKNIYFTTTAVPISQLPAAKAFAKKYKAKYGADPEGYSAYGYDAARVVIRAIAAALKASNGAKPERLDVAKQVRNVTFNGVTGKIALNARGDLKVAKYVVIAAQPQYNDNKVIKSITFNAPEPEMK